MRAREKNEEEERKEERRDGGWRAAARSGSRALPTAPNQTRAPPGSPLLSLTHTHTQAALSMLTRLAITALARRGYAGVAPPGAAATSSGLRPLSTSPPDPSPVTALPDDAAAASAMAGTAVLDFTATWCGPCRAMKAPFAALAASHAGSGVAFHTVDIDSDALQATVAAAGISAVPTFTFHRGGEVVATVQGADLEAVRAEVEKLVKGGE